VGLIQAMVPQNLISSWLGEASGFKGILIGSVIGMVFLAVHMFFCRF